MTIPLDLTALARDLEAHRLWQELLDKDDRTSPAEYPEMALITWDEFRATVHAAPAHPVEPGEVERVARILWECDCEEADEERRRHKMRPVEKWGDPWHASGTGVRQQRKYVFRAERILAALSTPSPAQPSGKTK